MRFRNMIVSFLFVIALIGFFTSGTVQALTFDNWVGTWFQVKSSEKGKAGPAVPPGGEVNTNNEKTTTSYLVIESLDITVPAFIESLDITVPAFAVGYCTSDGTAWVNNAATLPILGGEPENFLTFFSFQLQEGQNVLQSSWVPLEVKGKESRQTVGEITSASFKNLGGIFFEEVDSLVPYGGVGSVKFTGSLISPNQVTDKVPGACLLR
jgi:hypothetical protein